MQATNVKNVLCLAAELCVDFKSLVDMNLLPRDARCRTSYHSLSSSAFSRHPDTKQLTRMNNQMGHDPPLLDVSYHKNSASANTDFGPLSLLLKVVEKWVSLHRKKVAYDKVGQYWWVQWIKNNVKLLAKQTSKSVYINLLCHETRKQGELPFIPYIPFGFLTNNKDFNFRTGYTFFSPNFLSLCGI